VFGANKLIRGRDAQLAKAIKIATIGDLKQLIFTSGSGFDITHLSRTFGGICTPIFGEIGQSVAELLRSDQGHFKVISHRLPS